MASSVLNTQLEREAARVAAAFRVGEWDEFEVDNGLLCFKTNRGERGFYLVLTPQARLALFSMWMRQGKARYCVLECTQSGNKYEHNEGGKIHSELMVRGLYRLGFEDESILSQLPQLSAHEKLEARLSLPREFWPKTWLEEGE